MKIIIAGAGQIGVSLAKYLRAENNDIVLIDKDKENLGNLSEQLDIQTIEGSSAYPAILEKAGADHADIFLAVTGSDETNIVACGVARSVFNIQKRIARISSTEYLSQRYKSFLQSQEINAVLSPEIETANRIIQTLSVSGSVDMISLGEGLVKLIGLKCKKSATILGHKIDEIQQMGSGNDVRILAVKRRHTLIDLDDAVIRLGDEIYFVVPTEKSEYILNLFGYDVALPKYMLIFGGGKVGFQLAKALETDTVTHEVTLIEQKEERAHFLAEKLQNTLVINGDGLDETLVDELNFSTYKIAIATTQADESNILLSLLAKRNGIERTCALIHNPLYTELLTGLGIDTTIDPNAVLVSSILQHIRKGRVKNDYFIQSGIGEVLEIEALATSKITKHPLGKIKIPKGIIIGGIIRRNLFLTPDKDLIVQDKDIVILFVERGKVHEAEKLFTVGFSFF